MNRILIGITIFLVSHISSAAFQTIDLNSASKEQIMILPGVGKKLAQKIVAQRNRNGPFRGLGDLLAIDGCRETLLAQLQDQVFFSKPVSNAPAIKRKLLSKKQLSEAEIRDLILNFNKEPSVQQVQARAINYADANPRTSRSWKNRVRKAAWAPKLTTSGGRDLDRGESIRDSGAVLQRGSVNWKFNIKAEWLLGDLVFNKQELYVSRASVRQSMLRQEILENVTEVYFNRRRLQVLQTAESSNDISEKILNQIKIQEFTASLDGYTGGWFSKQIRASEPR